MDGCADSERAGSRGWAQSNEEAKGNLKVAALPSFGHRRTTGDEVPRWAKKGRRRFRRCGAPQHNSVDEDAQLGEARLVGTSVRLGEARNGGETAAMAS